jgi:hypothetical protein
MDNWKDIVTHQNIVGRFLYTKVKEGKIIISKLDAAIQTF